MSYKEGTSHLASMDLLTRKLTPILSRLLRLPPGHDSHPDVVRLFDWMTHPERSTEELKYVVGPLQEEVLNSTIEKYAQQLYVYIKHNNTSFNSVYVARIAVEAMAALCPVLVGQWELVALHMLQIFDPLEDYTRYGPGSNRVCSWIIHIVADPDLCPNPDLRLKLLQLYKTMLKVDDDNQKQALESLMTAFTSLDRYRESSFCMYKTDIPEFFNHIFKSSYMLEFEMRLIDKLKLHRNMKLNILFYDTSHQYSMGLKTVTQPTEIQGLIALIKYVSDGAHLVFKSFEREPNYDYDLYQLKEVAGNLMCIVANFETFREPELLNTIAASVMIVMDAMVRVTWVSCQAGHISYRSRKRYLDDINILLEDLCDNDEEDYIVNKTTIGQEIIRRYKERICKLRFLITRDFLFFAPVIRQIVYNDQY